MDILLYEPKYYNDTWNLIEYYKNGDTEILQFPKSFLNQENSLKNLLDPTYYNLRKLIFIIDNFKDNQDIQIPTKFMVFYNFYQDYINGNIENYNFYYIKDKFALSSFNKNNMKAIDIAFQDSTGAIINPTDYNKQQLFYCLLNTELDLNNPQSCIDTLNNLLGTNNVGTNISIDNLNFIPVYQTNNYIKQIELVPPIPTAYVLEIDPATENSKILASIDFTSWIDITSLSFPTPIKIRYIYPSQTYYLNAIQKASDTSDNFLQIAWDPNSPNIPIYISDFLMDTTNKKFAGVAINSAFTRSVAYYYTQDSTNPSINGTYQQIIPDLIEASKLAPIYTMIRSTPINTNKVIGLFNVLYDLGNGNYTHKIQLIELDIQLTLINMRIIWSPLDSDMSYIPSISYTPSLQNMFNWNNIVSNIDKSKVYFAYRDDTHINLVEYTVANENLRIIYQFPSNNYNHITAMTYHIDNCLYLGLCNYNATFARYNFNTNQLEDLTFFDPLIGFNDITDIVSLPDGRLLISTPHSILLGTF